ncbi:phosphorylcholine transferase LicD [Methanobrevibacter sp.]|uniref:LicD family protein n=1 Tax=Methanobrevibacter sp. TaxID=66852 RepID=UPI003890F836
MGILSRIQEKILTKSNSYNYYKEEYEKYDKCFNELDKKLDAFNKDFGEFNKFQQSNYNLFNTLFLYYDLKPKGLLKDVQDLCVELLDFVDNVCKKHDIEYWVDYGSLLGAVRHEGFIPWDDDMDFGMLRKDFEKFIDVIEDEIKNNNLEGKLRVRKQIKNSKGYIHTFLQLSCREPDIDNPKRKIALAGIDILSYDYITHYDDTINDVFGEAKIKLQEKLKEGIPRREAIQEYIEDLNVDMNDGKYIIPAIENVRGPNNSHKLSIYDKDVIMPLSKIKINGKEYPGPNNCDYYLTTLYSSEYSQLPSIVSVHPRLGRLSKYKNMEEAFAKNLELIRKVNENFK